MRQTNKIVKKKKVKRKVPFESKNEQAMHKKRKGAYVEDDENKLPIVHIPEDLVGKRVMHLCQSEI